MNQVAKIEIEEAIRYWEAESYWRYESTRGMTPEDIERRLLDIGNSEESIRARIPDGDDWPGFQASVVRRIVSYGVWEEVKI